MPKTTPEDLEGRTAVDLAAANERLKAAKIRLKIERRGNRLNLLGMLPQKQGEGRRQQRIALGLDASVWGVKQAEIRAIEIWAQLQQGRFAWDEHVDLSQRQTCGACVERFKTAWLRKNGGGPNAEVRWQRDCWNVGLRWLPRDAELTTEVMVELIESKPPDSRARLRCAQILVALAKFLQMDAAALAELKGHYSPNNTVARNLPPQEKIEHCYELFTSPWARVYALMATYGLRNHECWLCEVECKPPYALTVLDGKTGYRSPVLPFPPEWAQQWRVWEGELPQVKFEGDRRIYGERSARHFKRIGIPFTPYNLRHAYAIRASVRYKVPVSVTARMMGHSVTVHTARYHKWLSEVETMEAYQRAIAAQNGISS